MKFAIIVFPGTSCEIDTLDAITNILGEKAEFVRSSETNLEGYDAIILPGGVSYGDSVRPGAIASIQPIMKAVKEAAEQGTLVVGIGNGFQVLTEANLLPGSLLKNESLKFICRKVNLTVKNNQTAFTSLFNQNEEIMIPIASGYGNYYCTEEQAEQLEANHQIVLTYKENVNGSVKQIAGITNEQGNVFGLMPHPERAVEQLFGSTAGKKLFQSIVKNWRESHATNA